LSAGTAFPVSGSTNGIALSTDAAIDGELSAEPRREQKRSTRAAGSDKSHRGRVARMRGMKTIALASLVALTLTACATSPRDLAKEPSMTSTGTVLAADDRAAIRATIDNVARGADLRQWDVVRSLFAREVVLDYGRPEVLTPEAILERWRPLLSAFDHTQHVIHGATIAPVTKDRARVRSTFQATHHLSGASGGELWTLEGTYEHELVRDGDAWKIDRMRMIPGRSHGNATLLDQARARAGLPEAAAPVLDVERVTFESAGERLVGWLYRPHAATTPPAVVVTGAWTTVKEQMPRRYAEALAQRGFAALVFDFRGWGESDGAPRELESPARKTADIVAAARFLSETPAVDRDKIAVLGICASSGYAAGAAAVSPHVKSIALVAPWLHDEPLARRVYGDRYEAKLAAGRAAKAAYDRSAVVSYVPASSTTDASAAMFGPREHLDYYVNPERGVIPQWQNRFAEMSWAEWLTYDAHASAAKLRIPLRIVHSERAAIPEGAHRFYASVTAPKTARWLEGKTQFHFYDDPSTVAAAAAEVAAHFRTTL